MLISYLYTNFQQNLGICLSTGFFRVRVRETRAQFSRDTREEKMVRKASQENGFRIDFNPKLSSITIKYYNGRKVGGFIVAELIKQHICYYSIMMAFSHSNSI